LAELDDFEDDGFEDDSALQRYREQRLHQLKESKMKNRWGQVIEISRVDWVVEVTDSSKTCWVVVHLYQDCIPHCSLLDEAMILLAPKFRAVKFVKIRSTQAVENWPDRNLPTLFVYNEGELKHQMLTAKALGGDSMRAANLEWWLADKNVLESDLEEDPGFEKQSVQRAYGKHSTLSASVYDDEEEDD